MDFPIYGTRDLLGVMYDDAVDAPSDFWLRNFFPGAHTSDKEEIVFEQITGRRRLAPFVRPTSVGQPIWTRQGSDVKSFKPAYIKSKDSVRPVDHTQRQPGDLLTATPRTPLQNFNAEVARISMYHRDTIHRTWDYMAAQATIMGEVDINYEDGHSVTVDFGRDPSLTVLKGANYWDSNYDILGDIETYAMAMADAEFGGIPDTLIVGTDVWAVMRTNTKLKDLMDLNYKRSDVNLARGLLLPTDRRSKLRYAGEIGDGIAVWVYNDYYVDNTGTSVPFMSPKEFVLIDSNFEGVKAYGAILDKKANLQPLPVFPKMWDDEDPSATHIMTQSAPLMIPVYPNRSFRGRPIAL